MIQSCNDDTCLCTPEAFEFARQCNECVASSGLSRRNAPDPDPMDEDVSSDRVIPPQTSSSSTAGFHYSSESLRPVCLHSSLTSHSAEFSEACQAVVPGIVSTGQ